MFTLAVDPGIRGCGVALFSDYDTPGERAVLVCAGYAKNPCPDGNGPHESATMALAVADWFDAIPRDRPYPDRLALEYPRVYPGPRQKGDQNDLLPLAGVVCALAAHFPFAEVVRYFPRDWKGTVDPDVMIERIQGRLEPSEVKAVESCPKWLRHNLWDAVGIGLKSVGRFEPWKPIIR